MDCYLDNSATTRCLESVAEGMKKILCEDYGNPSSMHRVGFAAERHVRHAREILSETLRVDEKEIFFTSGGTESDNLALIGCAQANSRQGKHLITTAVEHPAVIQAMRHLEELGFQVTYLPVDGTGRVRLEALEQAIRPDTILVSMMYANNEVGALQPVEEAGGLIKRKNPQALFHVDAVQGYGKFHIYPKKLHIDLLSASAHKFHGPKGCGFLYVREGVKIRPTVFGGGQQRGLRSGTENVAGIAGMALAAQEVFQTLDQDFERMVGLRRKFLTGLLALPGVTVNGPTGCPGLESGADSAAAGFAAPHIVNASFAGVRSEVLLHALEEKGIYVSAGSACASRHPSREGSATLRAMGLKKEARDCALRFSFSPFTTWEELEYTLETLEGLLPTLRRFRQK